MAQIIYWRPQKGRRYPQINAAGGSGVVRMNSVGISSSAPVVVYAGRIEFTIPRNSVEFTIPNGRLEYSE